MKLLDELKRSGLQIHHCTDDECIVFLGEREYRIKFDKNRLEVWRHDPDEGETYEGFAESCTDHNEDDLDRCIEEKVQKALNYWNTEEELVCNLGHVKLFRRQAAVEGDYGIDVYRVLTAVGEIDASALLPFMIRYT